MSSTPWTTSRRRSTRAAMPPHDVVARSAAPYPPDGPPGQGCSSNGKTWTPPTAGKVRPVACVAVTTKT
jgi:hypothetical protein